jgi:hypothetical protein
MYNSQISVCLPFVQNDESFNKLVKTEDVPYGEAAARDG